MDTPRNASVAVIGAGDFIGAAITRRFAAGGYSVFAGRRNGEKLAPLVAGIEAAGGRCSGHTLDARKEEAVTEFLAEAEFDEAVEMLCQGYYKDGFGRPSIPPGRYFRMLFVGQFEGLDSEREIAWRCADSLSLHRFLRLSDGETVPDHSTLSVTRSRLPLEIHHAVFGFLLEIADKHDLVRGKRIGVDASTQEANAALRRLVRRDTGEDYQEMLRRLARESGIETPSAQDLIRFDRTRKNKTLSNADWASPTDPAARIARMKDGTTHLAYNSPLINS